MDTIDWRAAKVIVRCLRCRRALPTSRGPETHRACMGCGARVCVDEIAIDVVPDRAPPESPAARAMQSAWLARVYERWWRPIVFGLSTGFGAPTAAEEMRLVRERLVDADGPWLDLSCGPGLLTRELVANGQGRAVVGVDLSRAMLSRAHGVAPDAVLVRADAAALPFDDGTFGAVINLAALDLYPDPASIVAESARVLARGGRWICSSFAVDDAATGASPLSWLSGGRKPTVDWLADAATRVALEQFDCLRFRGYVVAWADKR